MSVLKRGGMSRVGSIINTFRTGMTLFAAGITLRSILLYPIRRRMPHPCNQIDLKNGLSIASPIEEGLLSVFTEVWINQCYLPSGFDVAVGDTVIDIGANVGLFTLWAASRHPKVNVIAIEPSPRMCQFLHRNISASKLRNVTVVQSASGGQTGEATLYSRGTEVLNSLYCHDVSGSKFLPLARTEVVTLDEVFDRYGVRTCHFLKLDCEGAEYEILLNARQATFEKIQKISMEYHIGLNEHTPEELVHFLESKGFHVEKLPLMDEEGGYLYASRHT